MIKKEWFKTELHDKAPEKEQLFQDVVLLFVLEGKLEAGVENKVSNLKADDILVINANKHFSVRTGGGILYLTLQMDYTMIAEILRTGNVIFWCDSTASENARYNDLRLLIHRFLKHYAESGENSGNFGYLGDCFNILNQLAANFMIKTEGEQGSEESDRYDERIQKIDNYINLNYDQQISMKDLAEKLYLSNGYLSRFFKKTYGKSFAGYLTKMRVYHAADDLLYTDAPVTRIAYNSGFTSAALFNKAFKKAYGQTPTEFRKKAVSAKDTEEELKHKTALAKRLEKIMSSDMEQEEDPSQAKILQASFAADQSEKLDYVWKSVINFGSAADLLQSSVREHLMMLKKALDFQYVRFGSIFSKELFISPDQENDFNFAMIDSILDYVLEMEMKPFIELGMKPRLIHYRIGEMKVDQDQLGMMDRITIPKWKRLMTAFMRHLSNRYGQEAMEGWKMELWYDETWRQDPEKNNRRYLELFSETYKIIKSFNENIELGGYSIRMDMGEKQRGSFLELWSRQECRPDFISVMYYGYERGGDGLDLYAKRTTDNESLLHEFTREKKLIADAGFADIPVYLNEWNFTPSVRNYINDTTFKGAFIVKNTIDLYGTTKMMGYGAGSDRAYAFFDTPEILFGGTGLITNDGILKPAAFAFEFLNRLLPYFVGKSRNCLVSTDRHNNYGIVCHNQQVLNYNYYLTEETGLDKENMWKYYEGRNKMNIRIRLTGVESGKYKMKMFSINDTSGSVMHIWEELSYEKEPSRNDIKYFRRVCEPTMLTRRTEAIGGVMMIEEQLQPNEIAFISIRKEN